LKRNAADGLFTKPAIFPLPEVSAKMGKNISRPCMPLYKTKAIILRSTPYAEADRIVSLYTLEFGKIRGIAKGAKRSQKRFGNTLEIGSYVSASFFEKETSELVRLNHCDLIRSFKGLCEDIKKLAWASYLIELINEMTGERIPNKALFRLLLFFLHLIDRGSFREEVLRVFEIRLFSLLGYQPQFNACRRCQKGLSEEKIHFSAREGGVICSSCAGGLPGLIPISLGTIKTLRLAQTLPLEKVGRISFSLQSLKESEAALSHFLSQYLGKDLKSKKFLAQLSRSEAPS
jgi:DNA repair protein RecO (recombination protein O)